jgi:hypothetical protein
MKSVTKVNEERNILQTIKRRKAHWIGHIWRRNCLLKHVIEGKIKERREVVGSRGRKLCWMTLRKERILETERGSTRSHCMGNWLRKWLWTCRKAENRMNE